MYIGILFSPTNPNVVDACSPYAPVSDSAFISITFITPSLVAPILTFIFIACLLLEQLNVSFLLYINFAGFPVFNVTRAENISTQAVCLPPKPPPILGFITLILLDGIFNALLKCLLTWKGICVEDITTNLPI